MASTRAAPRAGKGAGPGLSREDRVRPEGGTGREEERGGERVGGREEGRKGDRRFGLSQGLVTEAPDRQQDYSNGWVLSQKHLTASRILAVAP